MRAKRAIGSVCRPFGQRILRRYGRSVNPVYLGAIRLLLQVQLNVDELAMIHRVLQGRGPCRFLVFGMGNDTPLWVEANCSGKTSFVEDDRLWFDVVMARNPGIDGHLVKYTTRRTEWEALLSPLQESRLELALPDDIGGRQWDVILVDGPAGFVNSDPGRMQSIFTASRLAAPGADVFVHDLDRPVEQAYCDLLLGNINLVGSVGRLRHYRADNWAPSS